MKTAGELFEDAILHWRDCKGIGSAIIPPPLNDKIMVLGVLQRVYARSPSIETCIITGMFKERIELIEFITQQEEEENNKEFKELINSKKLKVLSIDFIKNSRFNLKPFVCIVYHTDEIFDNLIKLLSMAKFKLVVLNKLIPSSEDMSKLYSVCSLLDDFKQNEIDEIRTSTPVEDIWVDVEIPADTEADKLLRYYDEYITTSLNIFGSFEIMQQCRLGNATLNISATQICNQIAEENGWNPHLDMGIEINVEIDKLYNPSNIRDRATQTYEIIRNRSQLLSDYEGKLDAILNIVEENKDSKILIINKRGEFASKVTDYINNMSETIICGNYHDKVEPIPAIDFQGRPLYYKSGPKKGERRYMGAQAQKTANEELFNLGKLNILSTNAAPDKSLCIAVDVIIITSPQCEDVKSYIYRLSNVSYPKGNIKLYSIFIKNSLEQQKLQSKPISETHTIVNKCESSVVTENNSNFIVVD